MLLDVGISTTWINNRIDYMTSFKSCKIEGLPSFWLRYFYISVDESWRHTRKQRGHLASMSRRLYIIHMNTSPRHVTS